MTFEEKMAQAFKETSDERADRLMRVEKKHKFSLAYKIWEYKTLRDLRRGRCDSRWTMQKARKATTAMIVAFSFLIFGGTAYAAVAIIGRYGIVDKVDYSKVLMETYSSDKTSFEEYYGLPEEWELTDYEIGYRYTTLNYTQDEKKICFSQYLIKDGNIVNINTEKANVEMLSLYSENDGFVMEFPNNETLLYWIYDGYLLNVSGNIDKTKAIKLAYSTKIVDLEEMIKKPVTTVPFVSLTL